MRSWLARARSFWRGLRRPGRLESDMEEEMRLHLSLEAERIAREERVGAAEARRRAAAAFGSVDRRKEEGRDVRGLTRLSGLSLDVKLAVRMLRKSPGLTLVGVLSLALGVAVGVGFFVFFSTHLHPALPLEEGDRVVALENVDVQTGEAVRHSLHDFTAWRSSMRTVEQIGAASLGHRSLIDGGAPARPVSAAEMTAAGFDVARVPPLLGRTLVPGDEQPGAPLVAVIGYDLWQSRFQGDASVIGRSVILGDDAHVIVGVMPPGFAFPKNQELWTPLRASPTRIERGEGPELYVFGRLAAGASREGAQAELSALGAREAAAYPETNGHLRPRVLPYTYPLDDVGDVRLWEAAQMQLMVTLLLIAIAANVSVLVYARTALRRAEIAVRTALGASRRRIVAQLFTEALLLSAVAAALGLAVGQFVLRQAMAVLQSSLDVGFWVDYGVRPSTIVFATGLAVLAAVVVGVVPGLKSTGRHVSLDLRRLGGGASPRLGRAWTALIVGQVAVAVAILPTALTLGLRELPMTTVRTTFPAHEFLMARVALAVPLRPGVDAQAYRREVAGRFADRLQALEQRLEADPAVAGMTIEADLPGRTHVVEVLGSTGPQPNGGHGIAAAGIGVDYFPLLDVRVLAGRGFRSSDAGDEAGGVIVSRAFVQRALGGAPALGKRVRFLPQDGVPLGIAEPGPWLDIIGVVEDLQASALDPEWATPMLFYAVAPRQLEAADVLVRVRAGNANDFAPRLRQTIAAVDPDLRVGFVGNLASLRTPRYLAVVLTLIVGVLGTVVLLSTAGIHALMSLTVTRRRREIGIRTALGANPRRVLAGVFARAAWQLGLGGLAGAVLGVWLLTWTGLTRAAATPLAAAIAVMLLAGMVAAAGPARRGLRVQPMEALREE
jgi:putative ABC transport system permease protein